MGWLRETLAECVQQAETRIVSALDLESPVLPVALARILARAVGGARHSINGYVAWAAKQIHPQSADEENLTKHAEADGVPRNFATYASYTTGALSGTPGTTIAEGVTLKAPNGARYTVTTPTLANNPITVQAQALGTAGNQPVGTVLTFDPPLAGAGTTATIASGTDGADLEELEAWRARYLDARQAERLGGHESEYPVWARTVPGVTRVWAYRHEFGLGTVAVYFVRDLDPGSILPSDQEVASVATAIALKRPATADVQDYIKGPVAVQPLDLTIGGVVSEATRAKIAAELADLVWSRAEIGNTSGRGQILEEEIREAIRRITKAFTLVTTGDHPCAAEKLITMGTVTWV